MGSEVTILKDKQISANNHLPYWWIITDYKENSILLDLSEINKKTLEAMKFIIDLEIKSKGKRFNENGEYFKEIKEFFKEEIETRMYEEDLSNVKKSAMENAR